MKHVHKRSDGMFVVEIKVPERLRAVIGKSKLTDALGSRHLDAATQRKATRIIADYHARLEAAERKLALQDITHREEQEREERLRLLEGIGFRIDTPLADYIQFAASGWPNPETNALVLDRATEIMRTLPPTSKDRAQVEALAASISAQLETLRKLLREAEKPPSPKIVKALEKTLTVTGLVEKFDKTQSPTRDTLSQYKRAAALFSEALGDIAVTDVTRDSAREFRDYLHSREDLAFGTCDQRMKKLTALFNFASREGLISIPNPFTGMNVVKGTKEGHGDEDPGRYLEPHEVNANLVELLPQFAFKDSMRWPFLIMLHTGMRAEECCGLRLEEVVEHWGVWSFHIRPRKEDNRTIKSGKARYVPIPANLWTALGFSKYVELRREADKVMLFDFPRWKGKFYSAAYQERIADARKPLEEKLGFDMGDQHDLRHTLNTLLSGAGISEEFRCLILGQATGSSVNAGYGTRDAALEHLRDALNKVNWAQYDFSKLVTAAG